jgi:hypothetical protein
LRDKPFGNRKKEKKFFSALPEKKTVGAACGQTPRARDKLEDGKTGTAEYAFAGKGTFSPPKTGRTNAEEDRTCCC